MKKKFKVIVKYFRLFVIFHFIFLYYDFVIKYLTRSIETIKFRFRIVLKSLNFKRVPNRDIQKQKSKVITRTAKTSQKRFLSITREPLLISKKLTSLTEHFACVFYAIFLLFFFSKFYILLCLNYFPSAGKHSIIIFISKPDTCDNIFLLIDQSYLHFF